MSKNKKRPNAAAPLNTPASEGAAAQWLLRLLQQAIVLLLAVLGFLFCLLTSYQLDLPVVKLVWSAIAFALLSLAVFSVRRRGLLALICLVCAGLWIALHASDLLQGFLLLIEQAITPLSLTMPDVMQQLLQSTDTESALLLMTQAAQVVLFFVSFLSGFFIVEQPSVPGLALSTLPLLLPAPFYLLSPGILPFFSLLAAHVMVFVFNNGKRANSAMRLGTYIPQNKRKAELNAQRTTQQVLSLLALPLLILAALLAGLILPMEGYERPQAIEDLQQKIFSLELGKDSLWKSNNGLTRGDLTSLSTIRFSGATALQVRVSEKRSLYLRDFAGALYAGNGWTSVSNSDFNNLANNVSGIAPQNLLANAASASGAQLSTFTLSVRNISATPLSIWTPPGLVTQASEIENAGYVQDTALAFASSANADAYTLQAIPVGMSLYSVSLPNSETGTDSLLNAYQATAGSAYGLSSANGDTAKTVSSAASTYIDYVFDTYATLPDATRTAAEQLCQTYGIQRVEENGALNLAATCQAIHQLLSERCAYAYAPQEIPADADFTTYFLEQSRSGYCVHFATAATVLLRSLGIPARYAEGYIVIQADYEKQPDDEGFINIEDTHAHAWVEVFDPAQLEWIPIEMTTNTTQSTQPTPDENGDEEGDPTPSLTEPTPTLTPEPTPEPTVEPTPEAADESPSADTTPDPATESESQSEITPTPAPTDDGTGDVTEPETESEDGTGSSTSSAVSPPLWPVLLLLVVAGVPLSAFVWRKYAHEKHLRQFSQKDSNAAVLAICRYALDMLRFAGAPPMLATQSPEGYAAAVLRVLPYLDRARLESLLLIAQRARFSGKACSRRERDEVIAYTRAVSTALPARLPRLKRLLFRWRFPGL